MDHYFDHGCWLAGTRRALGYPSGGALASWVDELRPGIRRVVTSTNASAPFDSPERKNQAVSYLCDRQRSAREVAKKIGVRRPMLYKWKDQLLGDKAYRSMRKRNMIAPDDERAGLLERVAHLEQQVHRQQCEHDILTRANDLIKKTKASIPRPSQTGKRHRWLMP